MPSRIISVWPRGGGLRQPILYCCFKYIYIFPHFSCNFHIPTARRSLLFFQRHLQGPVFENWGQRASQNSFYYQEHLQCFGSRGIQCVCKHSSGLFFTLGEVSHHDMLENCVSFLIFLAQIGITYFFFPLCLFFFFRLIMLMLCLSPWWCVVGVLENHSICSLLITSYEVLPRLYVLTVSTHSFSFCIFNSLSLALSVKHTNVPRSFLF